VIPYVEPSIGNEVRAGLERANRAVRHAAHKQRGDLHRKLGHAGPPKQCRDDACRELTPAKSTTRRR
jgi:hypothetical protein